MNHIYRVFTLKVGPHPNVLSHRTVSHLTITLIMQYVVRCDPKNSPE